jgi:hypothetical protein
MRQAITRGMWAAAWLLLAAPAAAADKAELFKCVDAAGVTSIQSAPCAKGSTQVWRRDAAPEAPPTPEQAAQAQARRERDERTVRELSQEVERKLKPAPPPREERAPEPAAVRADEAPADAPDRCAQAQEFAAQLRDKEWLALSDDQVRRLYGWVATQCQPVPTAP